MYMLGDVNSTVYQYTLTTGFDLSTASYDSVSFSVASEDSSPRGLTFNVDGTKMFMTGIANDTIYQYTLSTGFDLSTASYDSVSFSVASEDASPTGVVFNVVGTKMFMVGNSNNTVYQYALSTGFDLSTASYDSISFSVSSEDTAPRGITFNVVGTKMFVVGNINDTVYQYTLTTGFDLSTASYDSVSFSVASEDSSPTGVVFNADGTKLYLSGTTNDTIYQYALSTGFDLTTASYPNLFSVASEDTSPSGIEFNTAGTKMFVLGFSSDKVHQYSLSAAFNVSTASYDSVSLNVASETTIPVAIAFNADGSKLYVLGTNVFQYSLTSSFDMASAAYDNISFIVTSEDLTPRGLAVDTKMYMIGATNDTVYQYTLLTALQNINPIINLLISDDGGRTFGTELPARIGESGDFIYKVEWFDLGTFYQRVLRLKMADPVQWAIRGANAEIEVGI